MMQSLMLYAEAAICNAVMNALQHGWDAASLCIAQVAIQYIQVPQQASQQQIYQVTTLNLLADADT